MELAAQVRSLYPFLGKWVFASFWDSEFMLVWTILESFRHLNLYKSRLSPSKPEMLCLAMLHPPGTRSLLLPGSWGWAFRKQSASLLFSPARTQGEQEEISHARFSIWGPARRPWVLVLSGPELERKRQKKCLNTVL